MFLSCGVVSNYLPKAYLALWEAMYLCLPTATSMFMLEWLGASPSLTILLFIGACTSCRASDETGATTEVPRMQLARHLFLVHLGRCCSSPSMAWVCLNAGVVACTLVLVVDVVAPGAADTCTSSALKLISNVCGLGRLKRSQFTWSPCIRRVHLLVSSHVRIQVQVCPWP